MREIHARKPRDGKLAKIDASDARVHAVGLRGVGGR